MSITMTIEIPALDRLCGWLESRDKAGLVAAIEEEIVAKLKEAAGNGTLEKTAKAPEPETAQEKVKAQETSSVAAEAAPPSPEGKAKEAETTAPAANKESRALPAHEIVTLDAVQRAAAQMRDDGKLKAVTDMFPEFGIKKLSDLKGDALQAFAERLRAMGAKI